jgi:hypothetical protein
MKRNEKFLEAKQSENTVYLFRFGWKRKFRSEQKRNEAKTKKIFTWACETHAKRISFRFVSLWSEKIFETKPAHPNSYPKVLIFHARPYPHSSSPPPRVEYRGEAQTEGSTIVRPDTCQSQQQRFFLAGTTTALKNDKENKILRNYESFMVVRNTKIAGLKSLISQFHNSWLDTHLDPVGRGGH